ncbi:MAG: PspC domain-containing protein [Flavobacteriaceae bacterium]|nr:PspC domain-containing protein [Flavobacteriaceae bacterium]
MNKTVNINLAGTFFHIDEDAYGKLQRYLVAIKKSLTDPEGSDEIIKDIEARIAELFSEKLKSPTQVVTLKELDEVIAVMGQPEDYAVDEELFEDAPKASKKSRSSHKQLFRDIDNKFISGVASGLSHYLGIDTVWVRLIWVLLTLFSSGTFIFVYILFWILVPAAESTSDKLKMTGEPINISNIEKKFKEGYETVADKVKNADYDKYGQKVKNSSATFFDTLGNIFLTLFKIFVKFIGVIVIIVSLSTLVALLIGLFTAGSFGMWGHGDFVDWYQIVDTTNAPLWLISLLTFFAVGIPFFVLFILGLKMLVNNLKSIGLPAKITLFIIWVASLVGLVILGVRQATETAFEGEVMIEETLPIQSGDTLNIAMVSNEKYEYDAHRRGGLKLKYNDNDEKIIYSTDVRLIIRSTNDSAGRIVLNKRAESFDYLHAKSKAEAINYGYQFSGNTLNLDAYLTTDIDNKYREQEVEVIVYMPVGSILYAKNNTYSFHRNDSYYRDILENGDEEKYLFIEEGNTRCLNCPAEEKEAWEDEVENEHNGNTEAWEEEVEKDFSGEKKKDSITITDNIN